MVCIYTYIFFVYLIEIERNSEHILALACAPAQGTAVDATHSKGSVQCHTWTVPTASHTTSAWEDLANSTQVNSSASSDLDKFPVTSMMKLSNTLPPSLWCVSQNWLWLHCASQWQTAVQEQQEPVLTMELHREYRTMAKFQESNT